MSGKLTEEEVARYHHDGFIACRPGFSREQAGRYRGWLEQYEQSLGGRLSALEMNNAYKVHLLFGWADEIVRHPDLLDVVESLIGPDILVFTSKFFIKEPGTAAITAWHQDATHFGFAEPCTLAVWVALSDAPVERGCLEYLPGSHKLGQLHHRSQAHPDSINAAGQLIADPFDDSAPVAAPLRAGQFSLHHALCVHSSAPNRGDDRRIGLSIHYAAADAPHAGSGRLTARLVRGEDRHGHFDLLGPPAGDSGDSGEEARTIHADAVRRYRENYKETQARHAAANA